MTGGHGNGGIPTPEIHGGTEQVGDGTERDVSAAVDDRTFTVQTEKSTIYGDIILSDGDGQREKIGLGGSGPGTGVPVCLPVAENAEKGGERNIGETVEDKGVDGERFVVDDDGDSLCIGRLTDNQN